MDRRALVQWLVATGGMAAFHRLSAHDVETIGRDVHRRVAQQVSESDTGADASDAQPARGRALNAHAAATVAVAAERIIPASDTPGATDARVTSFIDTMMTDWYSAAERDRFVRGLDELDERSRAQHGRVFVDVPVASQVTLLETVDAEVTALRTARGASANERRRQLAGEQGRLADRVASLERQVRAFAPAPGAWFELDGERCRVLAAEVINRAGAAGEVLDDQLTIACGFGALRPTLVQRAGRPVMDTASLLRGKPVPAGTWLA